jgi:hypothetical protein
MAQNKTKYGRKHVLDHFFGRIETAFPTNVYAALYTADPTDAGTLTNELTQTGYARAEISAAMGDAVLTSGQITNSADITFGPATEDWPEVTHIGIFLGTSTIGAGNMFYFGPAVTSRVVENNDTFVIRTGQLTIIEY